MKKIQMMMNSAFLCGCTFLLCFCSSGHTTKCDSNDDIEEESPMYWDIDDTTNYDGPDSYFVPVDTLRAGKCEMELIMDSIKFNFPPGKVYNYIMLQHDGFIHEDMSMQDLAYLAIGLEQADGAFGETLSFILYEFKEYPDEARIFLNQLQQLPQFDESVFMFVNSVMFEWMYAVSCQCDEKTEFLKRTTESSFLLEFPFFKDMLNFNLKEEISQHAEEFWR